MILFEVCDTFLWWFIRIIFDHFHQSLAHHISSGRNHMASIKRNENYINLSISPFTARNISKYLEWIHLCISITLTALIYSPTRAIEAQNMQAQKPMNHEKWVIRRGNWAKCVIWSIVWQKMKTTKNWKRKKYFLRILCGNNTYCRVHGETEIQ